MNDNLQLSQLSVEDKQKAYTALERFKKTYKKYAKRKDIGGLRNYVNNFIESFFKENEIDIPIRIVNENELGSIKDHLNDFKGMLLVIPHGSSFKGTYLYNSDFEQLFLFNKVDFNKLGIRFSDLVSRLVAYIGKKIDVSPVHEDKAISNLLGYRLTKSEDKEFDLSFTTEQDIGKYFIEQYLDIKNKIKGYEEVAVKLKTLYKAFGIHFIGVVIERIVCKCKTMDNSIDFILKTSFNELKRYLSENEVRSLNENSWNYLRLAINLSFNYTEFKEVADFLGILPKNNLNFVQHGLSQIIKDELATKSTQPSVQQQTTELSLERTKNLCKDCGADITGTKWAAGGFCEECLKKSREEITHETKVLICPVCGGHDIE